MQVRAIRSPGRTLRAVTTTGPSSTGSGGRRSGPPCSARILLASLAMLGLAGVLLARSILMDAHGSGGVAVAGSSGATTAPVPGSHVARGHGISISSNISATEMPGGCMHADINAVCVATCHSSHAVSKPYVPVLSLEMRLSLPACVLPLADYLTGQPYHGHMRAYFDRIRGHVASPQYKVLTCLDNQAWPSLVRVPPCHV